MSFHFGYGRGKLSKSEQTRVSSIARKHGATFTYALMSDGQQYWFSTSNHGQPFDGALAKAVMTEVGEIKKVAP